MPGLPSETIAALRAVSTATIATQLFKRGLRHCFLSGPVPLNREACRFVGTAFTLRYIPAREDLDVIDVFADPNHPQRRAVETVGEGEVLTIDCRGAVQAGSIGAILTRRLMERGAVAVVTDGAVRDAGEIGAMAFPVFASAASGALSLAVHHAVDMQVPIGCGGVAVFPGDVLVGDADGVVCIPRHLAESVAADALAQEELESFIFERIAGGAPLLGNYPPGPATLEAFRRSRSEAGGRDPERDGDGGGN